MQHSPCEIKDKLLQALDHEYNVVDMAAVLEVITALEKACITKEALEKTRIGKYINELRKRTNNEQLARRAKELVKSWRKLLPQTPQRINGEDILNSFSSPGSLTVLGPGPGPGFGPGPGPGNRIIKSVSVPGTPLYKTLSPSMMGERSSSPYFSSASNSPLLNSLHQGSNLPSNYAPVKLSQCHVVSRGEKSNSINKSLLNSNNQSKNVTSQTFKPISPSFVKQVSNTLSIGTNRMNCSPNVSPRTGTNSGSNSPSVFVSLCQTVSPTLSSSVSHSTLDIAKTNVANKRLRKEMSALQSTQKEHFNSKFKIGNGMSFELTENILPSESSAFKKLHSFSSNNADNLVVVTNSRTPKRKRSIDKPECHENRLGEMLAFLPSGSKHPKVKTTQQLIADLQAKKGMVSADSSDSISVDTSNSDINDVSRTKSEMLKKFLIAQSSRQESPTGESSVSAISEYGLFSVPDVSSVINTNLNSTKTHCDPFDEEINRILSALPPINLAEINLEDDPSPRRSPSNLNNDLSKLSEPWEYVNGVFDCNGTWRPWQNCSEQKSVGESFLILPYVNID